jgi:hypothetical protein
MDADEFAPRLKQAMKQGDLTKSDLALWFDKPFATVRYWIENNRGPRGPSARVLHRYLTILEKAVDTDDRFPIPPLLAPKYRVEYLKDLIRRHAKRDPDLPSARTSI